MGYMYDVVDNIWYITWWYVMVVLALHFSIENDHFTFTSLTNMIYVDDTANLTPPIDRSWAITPISW